MNILRHKSWHVRTRNNINRVKRDEEKAKNEELRQQKRIDLAESEARVDLLRQRFPDRADTIVEPISRRHLNIFEDFSDKRDSKNRDHEIELKDEKEKYETKTGILRYLVDKDIDSDHNWYLESHEKRMKLMANESNDLNEKELKDIKVKKFNDPIEDMRRYLDSMKDKTGEKTTKNKTSVKSIEFVKSGQTLDKTKSKNKKKKKKHKNKKRKRYSSDSSDDSEDNRVSVKKESKCLLQLRAERLERERTERERTRALLSGGKSTNNEPVILDDRIRSYNSQFNPEIARQNIDK